MTVGESNQRDSMYIQVCTCIMVCTCIRVHVYNGMYNGMYVYVGHTIVTCYNSVSKKKIRLQVFYNLSTLLLSHYIVR